MQSNQTTADSSKRPQSFVVALWGVRYQVKDVRRSVAFYTETLGTDSQWPRGFGFTSDAQWSSARTRRMESSCPSGEGFAITDC
jgi:hypothetical protein